MPMLSPARRIPGSDRASGPDQRPVPVTPAPVEVVPVDPTVAVVVIVLAASAAASVAAGGPEREAERQHPGAYEQRAEPAVVEEGVQAGQVEDPGGDRPEPGRA